MSHVQAIVDVALILCAVVTWVVLWRRDSAQQVQIDDNRKAIAALEHELFDAAARRLDDDARRLEDRHP